MLRNLHILFWITFLEVSFKQTLSQDSSGLQVLIPVSLSKNGGYAHQQALFGTPNYGGKLTLQLFYANSTMCTDNQANPLNWVKVSDNPDSPFILMIDRGECTFVSKTRRAQHAGAAGVLIADNRCLCSDTSCTSDAPCEAIEPLMADDGSGGDVVIPSFLAKKMDADVFKNQLMHVGSVMIIQMSWALPNPDDTVEWVLWSSPVDDTSVIFKQDFMAITEKLGSRASFEPHYMIFDGNQADCTNSNLCGNLCTNNGRYCCSDPDGDRSQGLSGSDVVRESLRQLCIWQNYGGNSAKQSDVGVGLAWWRYINLFPEQCGYDKFTDGGCITGVMNTVGIDPGLISKCMDNSGGLIGDVENTMLKAEVVEIAAKQIMVVPSVFVNTVIERGLISAPNVFSTICSGYAAGTEPAICSCATGLSHDEMLSCIAYDGDKGTAVSGGVDNRSKGISIGAVIGIALVIISTMTLAGFVYWKRTEWKMRDQVRGILAEYMPLEDLDGQPQPKAKGTAIADFDYRNIRTND